MSKYSVECTEFFHRVKNRQHGLENLLANWII